ncbi:Pre-mRNA-splicing factor of RES complex-domain-containing protein [Bisporella sp. PMI_857]|nr:Pre-mRNA-splicing factor of RES complex-domain-containing protein [Bisporella sp. PMI_857]
MSLSSYLASKYLTADERPSKKRKRSSKKAEGLIIEDDDALGWSTTAQNADDDDSTPVTVNAGSAEFRKAKKSAWKTVGVPVLQPKDDSAEAEADRIIREAGEEGRERADDETPVIEDEDVVKMGDGTHAGLQSAEDVKRQFEKRKREEALAWQKENRKTKGEEETVYRDATGRRIDISMKRAEAKKELDAKARKELEEKEAQKGDTQIREKERRKEELADAKFMTLARGVDDEDMNQELRERERWNDPAAQFLSEKKESRSGKAGRKGKPVYKGASAPNRYGIRPGHRWDGVDRGNGWEGERFKAMNRIERNKNLDYSWQMDT